MRAGEDHSKASIGGSKLVTCGLAISKSAVIILLALGIYILFPGCSQDEVPTAPQETIATPSEPSGPSNTAVGSTESYTTGGTCSSLGHDIEYRFDWGDGNQSLWSSSASASHSWAAEGSYTIKARARCATHTEIVSLWSKGKTVVVGESISTPTEPVGRSTTDIDTTESYSTGGAISSSGHSLEYRFDWGDGSQSPWSPSTSASHSWSAEGSYDVKAVARCAIHTDRVSSWSNGKTVMVGETISKPHCPTGQPVVTVYGIKVYCSGGSSSSRGHPILYQFDWEGRTFPLWTTSSCVSIYWSTVGTFSVRARARCAIHPEAVSSWSEPLTVLITSHEVITIPDTPNGPLDTDVGKEEIYSTGGAISSSDHGLEYRFDWGDGNFSSWSSSTSATYSWSAVGSYDVRAQARCAVHTARISDWSNEITVRVGTP